MKILRNIMLVGFNSLSLNKEQRLVFMAETAGSTPEPQGPTKKEKEALGKLEEEKEKPQMKKAMEFKSSVISAQSEKAIGKPALGGNRLSLHNLNNQVFTLIDGLKISNPDFNNSMKIGYRKGLIDFGAKNQDKYFKEIVPKFQKSHLLKIQLRNGVIDLVGTVDNQSESLISVDLKQHCEHFKVLERHEAAKQKILDGIEKRLNSTKKDVEGHVSLDKLINQNQPGHTIMPVKGEIGVYKINFKNARGKVDTKLELETRINNVFDLSVLDGGNVNLIIQVNDGKGKPYHAKYEHGSFYKCENKNGEWVVNYDKKGDLDRAKIFDGTTIKLIQYTTQRVAAKATQEQVKTISKEQVQKQQEGRQKERYEQIQDRNSRLFSEYYNNIMKYDRFRGHKYLQSKKDFEKWFDRTLVLSEILAKEPFNIKDQTQQKNYMRSVIGTIWSSEIQGKDFFKQMPGLYKGGYKQFLKDYKRLYKLKEQNKLTKEQNEQLNKIYNIGVAIARVYDSLKTMEPLNAAQESSREELDRTVFLNIPQADEAVKKDIKDKYENKKGGYLTYKLSELQFGERNQAEDINLVVKDDIANTIRKQLADVKSGDRELPADQRRESDLTTISHDPIQFMVLAHGVENLVKMGFIKKVDENRYILTQAPKDSTWLITTLKTLKEKNLDPLNPKSWEAVRGEIDNTHTKSVNFLNKIFDRDKTSVSNNFQGGKARQRWSRFWHWEWAKTKYVDMANLDKKTYGRNDFECRAVEKRGFMDMFRELSTRSGESGMYRIEDPQKVLNLTNQYLEHGIRATIANTDGDPNTILNNLKDTFGVSAAFKAFKELKKPEDKYQAENEKILQENVTILLNKISIRSLDTQLSDAMIRFIRLGYLEARYVETVQKMDIKAQYFSTDPQIKGVQERLAKEGMPLNQLPKVEVDFKAGLGALINSNQKVGVGGAVGVSLRYKIRGHEVHASIALSGLQEGVAIGTAVRYAYKKGNLKVFVGAGAGAGWVKGQGLVLGAAIYAGAEIDLNKAQSQSISIVAGAGAMPGGFGVSLGLNYKYNQKNAEEALIKDRMARYKEIKDITGFNPLKIQKIREHTDENVIRMVSYLDNMFKTSGGKCPDKVLFAVWERTEANLANACRMKIKLPIIKEAGIAAGIGVSKVGVPGGGVGLYLTFKVPYTEEIIAVRHVVKGFDQYTQERAAEAKLSEQLGKTVHVVENFTLKGENALLFFDSRIGGAGLGKIGQVKKTETVKTTPTTSFDIVKNHFKNLDIHAELVPKNPKKPEEGNFIQLTPLRIDGSNVEIQMDPELMSKGVILDNNSRPQKILLTASAFEALMITRKEIEFPFAHHKGMNLTIITFKTDANRHTDAIRSESPTYIYKVDGKRYQIVKSESTRGISKEKANVMTLDEYNKKLGKGQKFESFERVSATNVGEYKDLSANMDAALRVQGPEQLRMREQNAKHIANFGAKWYLQPKNSTFFNNLVANETTVNAARNKTVIFKRIQEDFAKANYPDAAKPLNEYELNILYSILIDLSFIKIEKEAEKNPDKERQITKTLERRNQLFREYMLRYINDWKNQNKEAWAKVVKDYPEATPEMIANYLYQCLPQDYAQMRTKLTKPVQIGAHMKFMSFTRKSAGEAVPSVYGVANTNEIQDKFFKVFGPTVLNFNQGNPRQKAAAQMVLNLLSPLNMKEKLTSAKEKVEFLNSDLALSLISLYDPATGIYPMIEVLGKANFIKITSLYEKARKGDAKAIKEVEEFLKAKENNDAFNKFHKLVLGVRNAQLNGTNKYKFEGFNFTMDTKVMAGPYLTCANGTIVSQQRFAITTNRKLVVPWSGAYEKVKVHVGGTQRKAAAWLTAGIGVWAQAPSKPETPGKDTPPSDAPPPETDKVGGGPSSPAPGGNARPGGTGAGA